MDGPIGDLKIIWSPPGPTLLINFDISFALSSLVWGPILEIDFAF